MKRSIPINTFLVCFEILMFVAVQVEQHRPPWKLTCFAKWVTLLEVVAVLLPCLNDCILYIYFDFVSILKGVIDFGGQRHREAPQYIDFILPCQI